MQFPLIYLLFAPTSHLSFYAGNCLSKFFFKFFSVGGIITGFLRGFDNHFNLLLTDVDEEYSLTGRKVKSLEIKGKGSASLPGILKR